MHYQLFGLHIRSALPLPCHLQPFHNDKTAPDVIIEYGVVPVNLTSPRDVGVLFQSSPGEILIRIDGVARYYVNDGKCITIMPNDNSSEDDVLVFLMGTVMGALLQQRGLLVLHAGGVVVNGKAVIFPGQSGAGKSTLTAGLYKRGYQFLSDDLCAVTLHNGEPAVIPGFPRLKLWADTLNNLELSKTGLTKVRWGKDLEKYFLPVEQFSAPVPLKSVFTIIRSNTDKIALTKLNGSEKIDPLLHNIYRFRMLRSIDGAMTHFSRCAAVAEKTDGYLAQRPNTGYSLTELMDSIEEEIS